MPPPVDVMAEPSEIFEQLDAMANAEPCTAEEDLIIRMDAVSKVRGRKGAGAKEKKTKATGVSPMGKIGKRKQPKRDKQQRSAAMQVEKTAAARPSAAMQATVAAVASASADSLRPRSHSV